MLGGDAANMREEGGEVSISMLLRRGVAEIARSCSKADGEPRSLSVPKETSLSRLPDQGMIVPRPAVDIIIYT